MLSAPTNPQNGKWYMDDTFCIEEGDSRAHLTSEQHQAHHLAHKELVRGRNYPFSLHTAWERRWWKSRHNTMQKLTETNIHSIWVTMRKEERKQKIDDHVEQDIAVQQIKIFDGIIVFRLWESLHWIDMKKIGNLDNGTQEFRREYLSEKVCHCWTCIKISPINLVTVSSVGDNVPADEGNICKDITYDHHWPVQ